MDDNVFMTWSNGRTAKTLADCQKWMQDTKVLKKAVKHVTVEDGYGCHKCYHARYEKYRIEHSNDCLNDEDDPIQKVKMQGIFQSNLHGFWILDEVELPHNINAETEQILLAFRQEADEFAKSGIPEVGCFPQVLY
jgi:hypothetical protein